MIVCKFVYHAGRICEVTLTGHAGYDAHGRDIVCAAVSAAADLTVHLTEAYFGVKAEVSADSPGNLHVSLPTQDETAHKLFAGLRDYLAATAQTYPQNIKIQTMEV